jgi:hypothetical protein
MEMIYNNCVVGYCEVKHNGVKVAFDYLKYSEGYRLISESAKRATEIGILQRLEETLNGSTEYLDKEEEEEKPSDQYIEMEKARDTLNRWLEANKNKRCVKGSE